MSQALLQGLVARLQELAELLRDTLADAHQRRRAYTVAGLPPDAPPPPAATWEGLAALDRYRGAHDPDLAAYRDAADTLITMATMLRDHIAAIQAEAGAAQHAHLVLRDLAGWLALPGIRSTYPRLYALGRLLGVTEETLHVHLSDVVHYRQLEEMVRFERLAEAVAHPVRTLRQLPIWEGSDEEETAARQSTATLLPLAALVFGGPYLLPTDPSRVRVLYGWEEPPQSDTPAADALAARTLTISRVLTLDSGGESAEVPVVLTLALVPEGHGGPALFVSLDAVSQASGTLTGEDGTQFRVSLDLGGTDQLSVFVPLPGGDAAPAVLGATEAAATCTVERVAPPEAGPLVLGEPAGFRLELGPLAAEFGYRVRPGADGQGQLRTRLTARQSRLVLAPPPADEGDAVLRELLSRVPENARHIDFDLALVATVDRDGPTLRLAGGTGLDVVVPVGRRYGPLRVRHVALALGGADGDGTPRPVLEATAGLEFDADWVTLRADRVGLAWDVRTLRDFRFRPPDGMGLELDFGPVSGGGYVLSEPERDRYAAVLSLDVAPFCLLSRPLEVTAAVLVGTESGSRDLLALVGVEWEPWHVGFGFTLNGLGGVLADERTVDTGVLRAGMRDGGLDAVLFPSDPLGNAPALVSALDRAFPRAEGQRVLGLMLRFGWGQPNVVVGSLAVLHERPSPQRWLLLGEFATALETSGGTPVDLRLAVVGSWDTGTDETALDGTLHDSRIAGFPVTGDGVWRSRSGEGAGFLLSLGGFHPCFDPPGDVPPLERLSLSVTSGDSPRVRFEAYVAVTPSTVQLGGRFDLAVAKGGFQVRGHLAVDLLVDRQEKSFRLDVAAQLTVRRGRTVIAAVRLDGTLSGVSPWRLRGTASLEVLFFSVSFDVDHTWGRATSSPVPEPPRAQERLVAALRDPRNWSAGAPAAARGVVSLRTPSDGAAPDGDDEASVLAHPLAPLTVSQTVLPLAVTIDRLGAAPLPQPRRFTITDVAVADSSVDAAPVTDHFAPGEYLTLTNEQRLARPAFEEMPAGVRFTPGGASHGTPVTTPIVHETVVVDTAGRRHRRRQAMARQALAEAAQVAEAARAAGGPARFDAPGDPVHVTGPRYAVVSAATLEQTDEPDLPAEASYTAAQEAATRHVHDRPDRAGALQVVGAHERVVP